ncbi:MAG: hypothetical protein RL378_79, partial [Actinomycetota bacterium]
LSGKMDVFPQTQEIRDFTDAALKWQVQHLVNSIPVN